MKKDEKNDFVSSARQMTGTSFPGGRADSCCGLHPLDRTAFIEEHIQWIQMWEEKRLINLLFSLKRGKGQRPFPQHLQFITPETSKISQISETYPLEGYFSHLRLTKVIYNLTLSHKNSFQ